MPKVQVLEAQVLEAQMWRSVVTQFFFIRQSTQAKRSLLDLPIANVYLSSVVGMKRGTDVTAMTSLFCYNSGNVSISILP